MNERVWDGCVSVDYLLEARVSELKVSVNISTETQTVRGREEKVSGFHWGGEMGLGWRRQVAGLLYTNPTHKQLFISQSPLVPPCKHQFSLYSPPIFTPLLLHPHPHLLPKPTVSVYCPSSRPSLLTPLRLAFFDRVPRAGQGTQLYSSPIHFSPSALWTQHFQQ